MYPSLLCVGTPEFPDEDGKDGMGWEPTPGNGGALAQNGNAVGFACTGSVSLHDTSPIKSCTVRM